MPAVKAMINGKVQDIISFLRISQSYFKRKNPAMTTLYSFLVGIQEMLMTGKRLKALQYRVQLMYYRIHQMEQLINENNPNNRIGGSNLNSIR